MRAALLVVALSVACTQDVGLIDNPRCDGVLQRGEDVVDGPLDRDGDGFVDGGNPDCQSVYDPSVLDCDDGDPDVNPAALEVSCDGLDNDCNPETADTEDVDEDGVDACEDCADDDPDRSPELTEITCNDLDDDCDESTPDGPDGDQDGVSVCEDCNDGNDQVFPGNEEVCDGIDNNCNDQVDETCLDYTGGWDVTPALTYQCADFTGTGFYLVNVDLRRLNVIFNDPTITLNSGGAQPGQLTGAVARDGTFSATHTITGSCDETYTLSGTFTDQDHFDAVFSVAFSGSLCLDCTYQEWSISGSR